MRQVKIKSSKVLGDIRFWIVALALLRLYGIANPPLEVSHSWRQTTVAMVARNFYEVDANPLYPRIDIGGELTGITGMEFPLLNYLIYLLSLLLGYHEWYGRATNLVVSSIGCWFFFLLVRRYFGERHAFCSTLILCASLWFAYARKIMPDTFSVSIVLAGLYYGTDYLMQSRRRLGSLIAYAILVALGVLSKLPSGCLLAVLLLPMLDKGIALRRKAWLAAASVLWAVPVGWWYFRWVPHLVEEFGLWHFFMGKGIARGAADIGTHLGLTLYRFYNDALKYIGFAVFIVGVVLSIVKRQKLLVRVLSLCFGAFMVVVLMAGDTFYRHDYYVIPFVPAMALTAGYAVSQIGHSTWRTLLLVAIALENILNQHTQFVIHSDRRPVLSLERTFDDFSRRDDLVCINTGEDPTVMYFTHRKGWVAYNEQLADEAFRTDLHRRGCRYILVMKRAFGTEVELPMRRIVDNSDYTIYTFSE